ncbi:MAG: hypothetical protein R8K47_01230, partial [Mariprofundaceae bacterium]
MQARGLGLPPEDAEDPFTGLDTKERIADLKAIEGCREVAEAVRLAPEVLDYIVDIVRGTREEATLHCGASPRAAGMLASAARALAALQGRDFVIP